MNTFRQHIGLHSAFRFRLRRQIAKAQLTDQQRIDLLNAIYDEAFIDELGNETIRQFGDPKGVFVAGGLRDWLANIDWKMVIQIALTLLMLFLDSRPDEEEAG